MYAAEINFKSSGMGSQAGVWVLAIFLLALAIMAWLTVREASRYESRAAIRNLRRSRKRHFPERELLPLHSQIHMLLRDMIRGGEITDPFRQTPGNEYPASDERLRREIDKLVGKEVYHGRKEQLKPPGRPASD